MCKGFFWLGGVARGLMCKGILDDIKNSHQNIDIDRLLS